jgi:alkylphenol/PAH-inducible cytochrome P450 monooxygenase
MVADPKALQYILQTSGYRFPKRADARANARMVIGDGIVYVHGTCGNFFINASNAQCNPGEQHKRHRKIMNPAFSAPQLKSFLTLFLNQAAKESSPRVTAC